MFKGFAQIIVTQCSIACGNSLSLWIHSSIPHTSLRFVLLLFYSPPCSIHSSSVLSFQYPLIALSAVTTMFHSLLHSFTIKFILSLIHSSQSLSESLHNDSLSQSSEIVFHTVDSSTISQSFIITSKFKTNKELHRKQCPAITAAITNFT